MIIESDTVGSIDEEGIYQRFTDRNKLDGVLYVKVRGGLKTGRHELCATVTL